MSHRYLELAVTPAVAEAQRQFYGAARQVSHAPARDPLGEVEQRFIVARDSFYLASVSETGWPYVQHRGGPAGFLRVVDAHTLAFADVRGNRQLLTTGHVAVNDRVALLLMDYPQRSRLKLVGHARIVPAAEEPALAASLLVPSGAVVERIVTIDVLGFDWNCPKYITPRYTAAEVDSVVAPLRARIAELEAKVRAAGGSV